MTDRNETFAMDGFGRVKPLAEGYVRKGGRNLTSAIVERPPPPKPTRQATTAKAEQPPRK